MKTHPRSLGISFSDPGNLLLNAEKSTKQEPKTPYERDYFPVCNELMLQ